MQPKAHAPILNEWMTGRASPSPIQYAFSAKSAPHAGHRHGAAPLAADLLDSRFDQLLSNPASNKARAIYLHVPFCRARCSFCSFFQNASSRSMVETYFEKLLEEIERKAETVWAQSAPFEAVYVGGGTPTDLTPKQLFRLGQALHQSFILTPDCEITLEGRLSQFGDEKFSAALEGGFNRFSFGVQSFDTKVRRAAKRLEDREPTLARLKDLTASKRATIAIDLMFGLPYQDASNWQQDLKDVVDSGVDGVDLYQLIGFSGTSLQRIVQQGKLPEPLATPEKAIMYQSGSNFFRDKGFRQLSYCHWARGDRELSRYNSMAKSGAEILGIGSGAGGNLGGFSYMQPRDLSRWGEMMGSHLWPVAQLIEQPPQQPLISAIVGGCDRGALEPVGALAHPGLFEHCQPLFKAWQQHGLATFKPEKVQLTQAGQFWSVNLAQGMQQYLQENAIAREFSG
ncbi:heme anaerobic degradation radical SAM methyltransferase ChuW/HutW [Dongshaea marina]|uniref:heme anaerobic degradation radical SAM methyltransferase ChuW/HutW n=1 Tax=Dongshaea marina TaxID=2047966 RepID=UPI000D3E48BB|nr:heme anaerobic degradation radical SAM methyltransferase ChuW/HutW [Dongshaea marina]